jgi:hypothetical protein
MAKVTTLILFFATALAAASVGTAPAAPEPAAQERQQTIPTPLHSLTGVAFHASAVGF